MTGGSGRHGRGTVAEAVEQQGWPASSPRTTPPAGDGRAMRVLRAVTYVLVSLVSLLVLAAAVYGAVQLNRLGTDLPQSTGGAPSGTSLLVPVDADPSGTPQDGGTSSGEEQFRYGCEQGYIPAEDCGG